MTEPAHTFRFEPGKWEVTGTSGTILVGVAGAVSTPGVYELEVGSTVGSALEAAGGLQDTSAPMASGVLTLRRPYGWDTETSRTVEVFDLKDEPAAVGRPLRHEDGLVAQFDVSGADG